MTFGRERRGEPPPIPKVGEELQHQHQVTETTELRASYVWGLEHATTLRELREHVERWRFCAEDALVIVARMDEGAFADFRRGLADELRKIYAGDQWAARFSIVVVPALMHKVQEIAALYNVPWGLAYIRLLNTGQLKGL